MAIRLLLRLLVILTLVLVVVILAYGLQTILWNVDPIAAAMLGLSISSLAQSATAGALVTVFVACVQGAILGTAIEFLRRGKKIRGSILLAVGMAVLVALFLFLQSFLFIIPQLMIVGMIVVLSAVIPSEKGAAQRFEYDIVLSLFLTGVLIIALDQAAVFSQTGQPNLETSEVVGFGGSEELSNELRFWFDFEDTNALRSIGFRQPPAISLRREGRIWKGRITVHPYLLPSKQASREPLRFWVAMPFFSHVDPRNLASSTAGTKCSRQFSSDWELVECSISLSGGEKEIILECEWEPEWEYVRLGEDRITFLLGSEYPDHYTVSAYRPSPILTLQVDPVVNQVSDAQPSPSYRLPGLVSWSLLQEGHTIAELTLVDHRLRFLADQGIEIVLLAVGLLLALVASSRSPQSVGSHNAQLDQHTSEKNAEGSKRPEGPLSRTIHLLFQIMLVIRILRKIRNEQRKEESQRSIR